LMENLVDAVLRSQPENLHEFMIRFIEEDKKSLETK